MIIIFMVGNISFAFDVVTAVTNATATRPGKVKHEAGTYDWGKI